MVKIDKFYKKYKTKEEIVKDLEKYRGRYKPKFTKISEGEFKYQVDYIGIEEKSLSENDLEKMLKEGVSV